MAKDLPAVFFSKITLVERNLSNYVFFCFKSGRYEVCDCDREKYWNDSAPQLPDGRSIPCEVNKFHAMMEYIADQRPGFQQVIAVDEEFDLFSRAWCLMEIAEAHGLGMPQRMLIRSARTLALHEDGKFHRKPLKGKLEINQYIYKSRLFRTIFGFFTIWQLGRSRYVQNTPTGCGNNFHTRQTQF